MSLVMLLPIFHVFELSNAIRFHILCANYGKHYIIGYSPTQEAPVAEALELQKAHYAIVVPYRDR